MQDNIIGPGPITGRHQLREAVSIHTDKIYDSCRDKDCLEDLRVFCSPEDQELINDAISIKARRAEIIWVQPDLERVPFNKGYFTVDVLYFFNVQLEVFCGLGAPRIVNGLAAFNKRVILFGSEGNAKIYTSKLTFGNQFPHTWKKNNLPKATVEVVDPIALSARLSERRRRRHDDCHDHHDKCHDNCFGHHDLDFSNVPSEILGIFGGELAFDTFDEFDETRRRKVALVTLGLFSIIRIERSTQLLIPAYDFAVPQKECRGSSEERPCEMFTRIRFPYAEFFPPTSRDFAPLGNVPTATCDRRVGELLEGPFQPARC